MIAIRRLLAILVAAGAGLALTACASPTHPASGITAGDLRLTRQFSDFTIYWVGRSFEGIPLTAADSAIGYDSTIGMRMYYGDCDKLSSPLSSVGCKLPLEITTVIYKPHSNAALGPQQNETIRGVPAVLFNGGRSIELYTGTDFAIDISADTATRARLAALRLAPANRQGPFPRLLAPPRFKPGIPTDPQTESLAKELRAPKPAILYNQHG